MFAVVTRRHLSATRTVGTALLAALLAGVLLIPAPVGAAESSAGGLGEKPFAPRSGPPGKTLFIQLAPDLTGVRTENHYADPGMWGNHYQEFAVGAIGTGVAIGDYDGDGRPDIFVVSKTESCRLFRNLGGFKFEDVTDRTGVGDRGAAAAIWKQGATFADVNNDGRLDLYICRFDAPNLLYINQGDGTFKEKAHAYGLDVTDASGMAAFYDYDRDGWLDVYIQTNLLNIAEHPHGQKDYLFHNNRDGTFVNVTDPAGIAGESQGHSATWWDYDNDGWPDLYVANDFGIPDKLYHNNRDGTFTDALAHVVPHTSFSSMGSDVGDVNNDGLIDFLVADMAATTRQKDQRGMVDQRGRSSDPPDHVTTAPKYQRNALFLNTGTGRCLEASELAGLNATDWTWAVRFADLDNDGRLDLFVTNGMNREQNNIDLLKRSMIAESISGRIRVMRDSPVLAEANLGFRNLGDLKFDNVSAAWGLDQRSVSFGAAFGDLDGDGDLDLLYSNYQSGVTLLRNDNDTGHRVTIDLRGTVSNRFGIGAIVRIESASGEQVRQLGPARGYMSSSEPAVHFGLGPDATIARMRVIWPSGHVQTFENIAADRRLTITEPSSLIALPAGPRRAAGQFEEVSHATGLALRSHEEVVDETYLQRLLPVRLNRRGPAVAVGTIVNGQPDAVIVGGTTLDPLQVLRESASGRFRATSARPTVPHSAVDDGPILLFDADGDGTNDLLVTKGGSAFPDGAPEYRPQLFLNDGQGSFRPAPSAAFPSVPVNAGAVAAADFDHDGRLDLFIGGRVRSGEYPLAPESGLFVNRGGKFENVTDALAPGLRDVGMVTSALWSDVDNDGWPDLILALDWGLVKYFHNKSGRSFEDWTEKAGFVAAGTGWWTAIAAADFNGDGRMDYVAGNAGLNTQYRASPEQPALLFSGDFTDGGPPQLIEAGYEGEQIYPWRSRRDLGAVIPSILERFPRNDVYARATLGQILGEEKLARADRFATTQLRSGVFLSQSDGTYRFEPLPRIAQIAPLQGLIAGDFDGDGHADVYAVQNSYAPIPAVGRFDGGLSQFLRGDGYGGFEPVPPAKSNLIVPGDAKALAVLDLDQDGWPDFLVTRNNDTTLAFRNHGVAGRKSLRVILRGRGGNPSAIGARITVKFSNGSAQLFEVHAGSGYYSQSTAAGFFGYPDSDPPKHIRIRWPGGATTEHEIPEDSTTVTISAPAG
jgi:hypothetical protein